MMMPFIILANKFFCEEGIECSSKLGLGSSGVKIGIHYSSFTDGLTLQLSFPKTFNLKQFEMLFFCLVYIRQNAFLIKRNRSISLKVFCRGQICHCDVPYIHPRIYFSNIFVELPNHIIL